MTCLRKLVRTALQGEIENFESTVHRLELDVEDIRVATQAVVPRVRRGRMADKRRPSWVFRVSLAVVALAISFTGTYSLVIAAWSIDPTVNTPISTRTGNEGYPAVTRDTAGNVFIGWVRIPVSPLERIYVQKLTSGGDPVWPANGVEASPILRSVAQFHTLVPDGAGGVYVVFRTAYMDLNGDGDVSDANEYFGVYRLYVQRLRSDGAALWAEPVRVVTFDSDLYGVTAAHDGADGVIVAWAGDYPNWHVSRDPNVSSVAVQHIDGAGNRLWSDIGRLLFEPWDEVGNTRSGFVPDVTSSIGLAEDGAGGAFVAWSFVPSGSSSSAARVNVARIDSTGARFAGAYNEEGTFAGVINATNPPDFKMVPDGLGGAIMAWQGNVSENFDIYAQKVDQNAGAVWQAGGLPVSIAPGGQGKVIGAVAPGLDLAADGTGAAFIAWEDPTRISRYPFGQKVSADGNPLWAANGVAVSGATSNLHQTAPRVVPDGLGGALFAWQRDVPNARHIYAQRLDGNGVRQWASDLAVSTVNSSKNWPVMAPLGPGSWPGPGEAVVAWADGRGGIISLTDIYAQGFSRNGELGTNAAPVANPDSFTTDEDAPLSIAAPGVLINDSDVDEDTLTAMVVDGPVHGMLTLNGDGSFTYTPAADYNGADSFTYKATDGTADSNTATVSIEVNPVNDAPVAYEDHYSVDEDEVLGIAAPGVLANDTDVEYDPLTAVLLTPPSHGSLTLRADGSFTYTPAADFNGADSFTYKATDGTADSNTAAVSIEVNPVNDAPVANAGPDQSVNEGSPVTLAGSGSDVDGDSLTFSWSQTSGSSVVLSHPDSTAPSFTAPAVAAETVLTFQLTVSDSRASASDTVSVTIRNTTLPKFEAARTIGYWKNHPDHIAAMLEGGSITLGDTTVTTVNRAVAVLSDASARDARASLRAQLLASILNLRNGANPDVTGTDIRPVVESAKSFLATHSMPVDSKHPDRQQALQLKDRLEAFNASGGI